MVGPGRSPDEHPRAGICSRDQLEAEAQRAAAAGRLHSGDAVVIVAERAEREGEVRLLRLAPLTFLLGFADASDHEQAGLERAPGPLRDRLVGLAEVLATLGVPDAESLSGRFAIPGGIIVAAVTWTVVRNLPGFPLIPTVFDG